MALENRFPPVYRMYLDLLDFNRLVSRTHSAEGATREAARQDWATLDARLCDLDHVVEYEWGHTNYVAVDLDADTHKEAGRHLRALRRKLARIEDEYRARKRVADNAD